MGQAAVTTVRERGACVVPGCERVRYMHGLCMRHDSDTAYQHHRSTLPYMPARGITLTDKGRAYLAGIDPANLDYPAPHCNRCGQEHWLPRYIGVAYPYLVVCFGAAA